MEDRTIDAQKFLSCVSRTQQRFGMRHIVDILRGANTQRIRALGHDQLTTYGIGRDNSADEWMRFGRALLQQDLLREENSDGYPILKLNRLSMEILRKQRSVEVAAAPVRQQKADSGSSAEVDLTLEEMGLFQHLRTLRKELADALNVPPYVVFPDSSLRAMAQQRPQSEDHFAHIPGVGSRKLEAFYAPFTRAIRDYCEEHNLEIGLVPLKPEKERKQSVASAAPISAGPSTRMVTLDLYKAGRSIEEIATERNLKPSTISSHLAALIEMGEDIDVMKLLVPGHYDTIVDAILKTEGNSLTPIKELLGEEYSYDEIRLVLAMEKR